MIDAAYVIAAARRSMLRHRAGAAARRRRQPAASSRTDVASRSMSDASSLWRPEDDAAARGMRCACTCSARQRVEQQCARRHPARDKAQVNAFIELPRSARCARRGAIDAVAEARRDPGSACRRAVRGEEPVRRARPATLAGSKINRATAAGARAMRPLVPRLESRRCGAGRHAQHGRVRVRLLDRELALRADAQSARSRARRRRLVGRLGGGRRGGPGAADAGLRHQRLDSRAGVVLRRVSV